MSPDNWISLLSFILGAAALVLGVAFLISIFALPFWVNSIQSDMKLVIKYLEIFRVEMERRKTASVAVPNGVQMAASKLSPTVRKVP